MRLKDKVAIITGSSRGIGKAMAIDFAKEGAKIVVAARTDAKGRLPGTIFETEEEIKKIGGQAIAVRCDVTNEQDVEAVVQKSLEEFGRVDILVNNAAVGYYKTVADTPLKHWDLVMRVNVRGNFLCTKAVLPHMITQRSGSIVNMTSSAAQEVFSRAQKPGEKKRITGCAYGASKAAIERLTIGLAEEVKEYNIAVNGLKPTLPTYSEGLASWISELKLDLISPHIYMTKAAIFLATQDASGITGGVFFDKELCEQYHLT